jgi:hypothetical protein
MTGTPDSTTCRMSSACPAMPSTFTACAPEPTRASTASMAGPRPRRIARNGMSVITNCRGAPRTTAPV